MDGNNKLLVVDVNYLLSEFKENSLDEIKKQLEEEYNCQVIFIDSSTQNINNSINNNKAIYFA